MNRVDYKFQDRGFVGHLSMPENETEYGVIVIMSREKSVLPRTIIADRFSDLHFQRIP